MQNFPDGVNPREYLSAHRERGPKRFEYTVHDVAELLGVSVKTVYNMKSRKHSDRLDMTSLESICRAWAKRKKLL